MNGFVFYDGPSELDGAPIIGIAVLHSENEKTGDMVQTYILRADMDPLSAIQTRADVSICGFCPHGPGAELNQRTCYVDVGRSVSSVFSAWIRGSYPAIPPHKGGEILAGRPVRIGSYGDPAAIPLQYWIELLRHADGHTGYTHQWRLARFQAFREIVMASADSVADRDMARAMGWRTFRIRTDAEPLGAREFSCPASDEAGHTRQCITCKACNGAARGPLQASVAIIVHGRGARHFQTV